MNQDAFHSSLEKHFLIIDKIILSRQDPITGLLPASTAVNAHGDYTDAWVRDNVYSILSVWGLALSYRKHDPAHHRSFLLSQSVVKLMRGLLLAMMRQSDRVEAFKNTLNPTDALHAKYGTKTGLAVVGDDEWGHLQLDATSLFLLMIAQMTASGLRLIFTMDEVNFVQNLVHYVSHTYCTPDFGIWERGNKINHGTTEINGSSVGMAKAALEAMDGFNLFGNTSSYEAVIYVIPSDIARSRFTLQGLLPRESNSKETDAALLSIIGYPAYAIEDENLVKRTRDKIIKKLAGNYGCKRFLLDGHQSSIEDDSRLHYEPSELREFEHIESEWPLFFTYLLLDALMRDDAEAIAHWQKKLQALFVEQNGQKLLPELYIVPKELIDAEKQNPGSQKRIPNENVPLVWAQSLYMLSDMILDGLLHPSDIDPLHRCKRIGHTRHTQPLVPILAENESVKQQLLELGFKSETFEEVAPIKMMHSFQLSQLHTLLGKNKKLSLTGRPLKVARTMATASLHLLAGEEIVFLPYYFNPQGFYFSSDNQLLVDHFRASLKFLAQQWDKEGQPLMPLLIRESMLSVNENSTVYELLHELQRGACDSIAIKTGSLRQLLSTAAIERIDNLQGFEFENHHIVDHKEDLQICTQNNEINDPLTSEEVQELENKDDDALIEILITKSNRLVKTYALILLWEHKGQAFEITTEEGLISLSQIAEKLYESATVCHEWAVIRRIANLTGKYDDRLEDVLLDILVRQKRLAVGRAYNEKATFSKPKESMAIVETIVHFCGNNTAESTLTQEVMLHLGHLIRTEFKLFENMLTLRTWYFIQLLVGQVSREQNLPMGEAYDHLLCLAPHTIYNRLKAILKSFTQEIAHLQHQENLHASGTSSLTTIKSVSLLSEFSEVKDWNQWRQERGMLSLLSETFYKDIWYLLRHCNALVLGEKYNIENRIGSEFTLETTAGEQSFALRIDALLQSVNAPEYRHLTIEVLESLVRLFKENPELHVDDDLILDVLIGHAVRFAWEKNHHGNYNEERGQAWESFYYLSPQDTDQAFIGAFMHLLVPEEAY
ncbi:MAG: glycoside hydrolase family 15 protein [Campylobacterota bacterium]|nr:glycoside hydrolase family 15 protein [Campylobacterota bacterium]